MKKIYTLMLILCLGLAQGCGGSSYDLSPGSITSCGTYNGKALHKGPRGGCYYINSNNNKTYVDRSYCRC